MTDALATTIKRAQLLLDARRYDAAIEEAGKALAQSPEHYPAQILLARALLGAGRYFDALSAAERAIALQPESADPQGVVAQAAIHLHRLDRADRATAEGCRLAPGAGGVDPLPADARAAPDPQRRGGEEEEAALVRALDPDGLGSGTSRKGEDALHLQAWSAAGGRPTTVRYAGAESGERKRAAQLRLSTLTTGQGRKGHRRVHRSREAGSEVELRGAKYRHRLPTAPEPQGNMA